MGTSENQDEGPLCTLRTSSKVLPPEVETTRKWWRVERNEIGVYPSVISHYQYREVDLSSPSSKCILDAINTVKPFNKLEHFVNEDRGEYLLFGSLFDSTSNFHPILDKPCYRPYVDPILKNDVTEFNTMCNLNGLVEIFRWDYGTSVEYVLVTDPNLRFVVMKFFRLTHRCKPSVTSIKRVSSKIHGTQKD